MQAFCLRHDSKPFNFVNESNESNSRFLTCFQFIFLLYIAKKCNKLHSSCDDRIPRFKINFLCNDVADIDVRV